MAQDRCALAPWLSGPGFRRVWRFELSSPSGRRSVWVDAIAVDSQTGHERPRSRYADDKCQLVQPRIILAITNLERDHDERHERRVRNLSLLVFRGHASGRVKRAVRKFAAWEYCEIWWLTLAKSLRISGRTISLGGATQPLTVNLLDTLWRQIALGTLLSTRGCLDVRFSRSIDELITRHRDVATFDCSHANCWLVRGEPLVIATHFHTVDACELHQR